MVVALRGTGWRTFGKRTGMATIFMSRVTRLAKHIVLLAIFGSSIDGAFIQASAAQDMPPPEFSLLDENFVDLVSFTLNFELTDLSIGDKDHPLQHRMFSGPLPDTLLGNGYFRDISYVLLDLPTPHNDVCADRYVIFGDKTEYFAGCNSRSTPSPSEGRTGSSPLFGNYTRRDGSVVRFTLTPQTIATFPTRIEYPDGRVLTWGWCADGPAAGFICSLTRSDGLQLKYNYTTLAGYQVLSSIVAINNAYEYCSPTASTCALSHPWPTVTYTWTGQAPGSGFSSVLTVTDPAGRQTRYTQDSKGRTVGIKLPSSATADNLTYTYCGSSSNWCSQFKSNDASYQGYVQSVVRNGQTWSYSGAPGGGSATSGSCGLGIYTVTNPAGGVETAYQNYCFPNPSGGARLGSGPGVTPFIELQTVDGTVYSSGASLQSPTSDPGGRVWHVIKPEGNHIDYGWDDRGNLTQSVLVPKSGSPLTQVALSANYDTSCTYPAKCNKPNWFKDGMGNQTDYTYDTTYGHGGILTKTLPPDSNGIRPQTRYTYTQRYAWVLNSSGIYVRSAAPIWVLYDRELLSDQCRRTIRYRVRDSRG